MESPIKFDLSSLSYPVLLQITVPFLPGGVFVCGVLYLDTLRVRELVVSPALPTAAKVVLALFATFVIGFGLHFGGNALTRFASHVLGYVIGSFWTGGSREPHKNIVWRKVARAHLGDLAPRDVKVYSDEIYSAELAAVKEMPFGPERTERMNKAFDARNSEDEWYWWHEVLATQFPPSQPNSPHHVGHSYFVSTLYSVGWAWIMICHLGKFSWELWAFGWLLVVAGFLGDSAEQWFSIRYGGPDPQALELAARIRQAAAAHPVSPAKDPAKVEGHD